jgi:hypothetical protein
LDHSKVKKFEEDFKDIAVKAYSANTLWKSLQSLQRDIVIDSILLNDPGKPTLPYIIDKSELTFRNKDVNFSYSYEEKASFLS